MFNWRSQVEAPIKTKGCKPLIKAGPNLYQSENAIDELSKNGFNLFNLANNHIMDYGDTALKNTLEKFNGVDYLGAGESFDEAYKMKIIKIKNKRIGFLSFSEWGFGVISKKKGPGFAWINHPETKRIIENSRKQTDFLIVQIHAGEEDINLPQPEWRKRYKEVIDLGADLIIGHHPHVPHPIELYKGKSIIYSLGNFYFKKFQGKLNYIFQANISLEGNNKIKTKIIPIIQKSDRVSIIKDERLNHWLKNYFKDNSSEEYSKEYNKIAKERYLSTYDIYFSEKKIIRLLKNSLKRILKKKVIPRSIIMEHLRKRESHKFIISRYNDLINNGKKKK
jgi:poly-gamma-glutamate capsule biosynthesis protein CapA/YwtB (metallophosphatase superfamily)